MTLDFHLQAGLLAIFIDLLLGDPAVSFHPIVLMGKSIQWMEKKIYKNSVLRGGLMALACVGIAFGVGLLVDYWVRSPVALAGILFWGLSTRSMAKAISDVRVPLENRDLTGARAGLSRIVTRDTSEMLSDEVIRTTLESGSENIVDGVLAPIFFMVMGCFLGIPVAFLAAFKMVSTLDSMIGYRTDRYERFGKVAARMDDVVMFLPARLFILFACVVFPVLGLNLAGALTTWRRDRKKSTSVNSGYSESLISGGLGTWFGGPVRYFGIVKENPIIGLGGGSGEIWMLKKMEILIYCIGILMGGALWLGV